MGKAAVRHVEGVEVLLLLAQVDRPDGPEVEDLPQRVLAVPDEEGERRATARRQHLPPHRLVDGKEPCLVVLEGEHAGAIRPRAAVVVAATRGQSEQEHAEDGDGQQRRLA